MCNIHGRHGASAFFGGGATRTFCGLVGTLNKSIICGRTSFHLVAHQALRTLISCPRHGLFLHNVISTLKCPSTQICCSHGRHFTKRSGCPLDGVLDFTLSKVASFSIHPLHCVTLLNVLFVLVTVTTVVCNIIMCVRKGAVTN